jgi:hypothetical protein
VGLPTGSGLRHSGPKAGDRTAELWLEIEQKNRNQMITPGRAIFSPPDRSMRRQ